ncbi:helix-turn-helix domain-containing protein [Kribbella sp. NPDC059898]|uniref:helix-turn-helix domain-containing protein n=1 Tax=Kribbella sp. NPDC059898 TaxID=3346995 RepID=UPI0036472998
MARPVGPPTVRLRRLATELKALRAEAKLTREQVEDQTGVNQGTLWRLETGQTKPHNGTLETLFELYGVSDSRRAALIELAKDSKLPGWFRQTEDANFNEVTSSGLAAYIGFEAEAKSIHTYESSFVPGLLQTEAYARAVMLDFLPIVPDVVEMRVRTRMARQVVLTAERQGRVPLEFWAVIDEAVLRRQVGSSAVMREQLEHLLQMSDWPNVMLQVVPFGRGMYPGMGSPFSRLRFGGGVPDVIHADGLVGDIFLEREADVELHGRVLDHVRALALSPRDSGTLLAALIAEQTQ